MSSPSWTGDANMGNPTLAGPQRLHVRAKLAWCCQHDNAAACCRVKLHAEPCAAACHAQAHTTSWLSHSALACQQEVNTAIPSGQSASLAAPPQGTAAPPTLPRRRGRPAPPPRQPPLRAPARPRHPGWRARAARCQPRAPRPPPGGRRRRWWRSAAPRRPAPPRSRPRPWPPGGRPGSSARSVPLQQYSAVKTLTRRRCLIRMRLRNALRRSFVQEQDVVLRGHADAVPPLDALPPLADAGTCRLTPGRHGECCTPSPAAALPGRWSHSREPGTQAHVLHARGVHCLLIHCSQTAHAARNAAGPTGPHSDHVTVVASTGQGWHCVADGSSQEGAQGPRTMTLSSAMAGT